MFEVRMKMRNRKGFKTLLKVKTFKAENPKIPSKNGIQWKYLREKWEIWP